MANAHQLVNWLTRKLVNLLTRKGEKMAALDVVGFVVVLGLLAILGFLDILGLLA